MDQQSRVIIPSAPRKDLAEAGEPLKLIITKNLRSSSLILCWESMWRFRVLKAMKNLSGKERYQFASFIAPTALTARIDNSGRMSISEELLTHAKLKKGRDVLLVGKFFQFEMWNPALYEAADDDMLRDLSLKDMANRMNEAFPYDDDFGLADPRSESGKSGDAASVKGGDR